MHREDLSWVAAAIATIVPAVLLTRLTGSSVFLVIAAGIAVAGFAFAYFLPVRDGWLWGLLALASLAYVSLALLPSNGHQREEIHPALWIPWALLSLALVAGSWFVGTRLGRLARKRR